MKVITTILGILLSTALHAQTATPSPAQPRCSAGTYVTCSMILYMNGIQQGTAGVDFNRGANPGTEADAYLSNPAQYQPKFTVYDGYDGYQTDYVPTDARWSVAGNFLILDYTTAAGKKAHVVLDYLYQSYGAGRTVAHGFFWTVMSGTEFDR